MGAKARGFLLLSFAFSSVLSSSEVTAPSKEVPGNKSSQSHNSSELSRHALPTSSLTSSLRKDSSCSEPIQDEHELEKRAADPEPEKRAPMGFHGMRGKKEGPPQNYLYVPDELDKRAPMGFQGMRGKKTNLAEDEEDEGEFLDELAKRAPMGFQGMRGKKDEDLYDKRAAMGFQGMRGKKDEELAMPYLEQLGSDYYGYGPELDSNDQLLLRSGLYDEDLVKRAMGFHGMRGKKLEGELLDESGYDKRASMGFHGMRGKKENDFNFKRAMGFLGMRGKKAYEIWRDDDVDKRAQSGFFGMRGKKAPANSAFFGMRGKKAPSGFFGMKGKREPIDNEIEDMSSLINHLSEPETSRERIRRGTSWLRNSKKAKSAFFGMRGKKSWAADNGLVSFMSASE